MKKITALFLILLTLVSCKKLEDLNKNTKDPTTVSGESLFTGAQKAMFDQMVTPNVNLNIYRLVMQQWTETTYTDESNYDLVTRTIPDNQWDTFYRDVLEDFKQAGNIITSTTYISTENPAVKKNKLAINDVMMVFTFSVQVETFGDIPYTKALDINNVLPVYDDGLTVYKDLVNRLTKDIQDMDPAYESFGAADNMYQGDVSKWIKFANSLKLHMGMILSDVDEAFARTTVEAAAPGVMASNDDNARLIYLSSQPNSNPVFDNLVASGRHDFVPANTLVDLMNNLNDPRRQFYFTQIDTSGTIGTVKLAYVGGINGASNDFTQYSHVADRIQLPTFEGLIFDYAQTEFLLAEAASKNFNVGGTAEEHYNKGIEASILYWGGSATDVSAYLAEPGVAWATATGDYKEKIGMQFWIALYNRGFESWTQQRLLDYPALVAPPDAVSAFPVRYTYPISEQTLNGANYEAASAHIGGDAVTTKLFWDKF